MDVSQAQEAKQLRDENTKLRKLVADLSLDKEALQSVIRKTAGAQSVPVPGPVPHADDIVRIKNSNGAYHVRAIYSLKSPG